MTKNKLRKAAVVAIAGLMMAQTALTGCGKKTVDYDVDGTQSQEEGGDKKTTSSSRDGIGGKLGIPDGCDETINVGNSGLGTITIKDDDIEVPDTDKMDVMHITPTKISNEEKKNIAEKVFEKDKGIYMYDEEHQTKSDYEEQIASYKEMIDEAKEEGDTSWQTYMEEEIKTLEEEMAKAPDEYTEAGDYDADGFLGTRDGMQYQLYIYNASDDEEYPGMGSNVYIAAKDGTLDIRPYEGAASAYCSDYLAPGTNVSANASSMSKEEAEDIAGKFLADLGITDIVETEAKDLMWEYMDNEYNDIAMESDGYAIKYARAVGGASTYSGDIWNVDNLQTNDGWVNIPSESYYVYVYDGKVIEAGWNYLAGSADSVEENVDLLSYDQIIEKANTEFAKYYEKYATRYKNVAFNDVKLTYYIVSDGEGKCKYIPVWVFTQYQEMQDSDGSESPEQIIIMNAMDGTIVDIIEEAKAMGCYQSYN